MTSEKSIDYTYTALLIGVPVLVGAGCCYIYYSNRNTKSITDSDPSKKSQANNNSSVVEEKTPLEKAKSLKELGNQNFSAKNYGVAIDYYTKAIELAKTLDPPMSDDDMGIFYQNRGAANDSLSNYEKVVEDCTKAIEFKKNYSKAYRRRANAYCKLEQYDKAMVDAFSTNILEKFQDQNSMALTESIVQLSSKAKAVEAMKRHKFDWPDDSLVKTYFSGFPTDPIKEKLSDPEISIDRCEQLKDIFEEAKKPENDNDPMSLLIRGSCLSLMGDLETAHKVFDKILEIEESSSKIKANALMKKSVLITSNLSSTNQIEKDIELAIELLEKSKGLEPTMPDVYLHLAQAMTMLEKIEDVVENLNKAIKYHPKFYGAIAQKLYIEFKISGRDSFYNVKPDEIIRNFKKHLEQYDNAVEIQQIYAQILTELNCFEQADELYVKLIEQDPNNFNALTARALLQFHIKSDPDEIACMMRDVIKKNPKNLIAYDILGSLEIQRDRKDEAIEIFEAALSHASSEAEYARSYGLLDSAKSQKIAVESLGLQP